MKDKFDIGMLIPGMPFDGNTLEESSLGGSETAAISMARELAQLGHRVKVFCNCKERGNFADVIYLPIAGWDSFLIGTPHDVSIVQRTPEPYSVRTNSRLNVMWSHDLALGRQTYSVRATMWNINKIFVLSEYMKAQYKEVYGLPDDLLFKTRNGIDLHRFPRSDNSERNRKRLVYAARPERGLDILLDRIFPKLLEADPEIELALYGYHNPVEQLKGFYATLAEKSRAFGDRVRFVGQLTKNKLYEEYAAAGVYAYPTPSPTSPQFAEISCISLMEAQASGMPVVTSDRGALSETLAKGAGVLISGDSMSDEYRDAFVEAVLKYTKEPEVYNKASAIGKRAARTMGWDKVAEEWSESFSTFFEEVNDNPTRLAYHFYQRSDIFAAKKALEGEKTKAAATLRNKIEKEYSFIQSPESLKKHYGQAGKDTLKHLSKIPIGDHNNLRETTEKRFIDIAGILEARPDLNHILDYGCGHGWSSIYLHNKIGRSWVGVDLDPGAVAWSSKLAKAHAETPDKLVFLEGDHTIDLKEYAPFDCLIVSEVLEHCPSP